jgi:hypothetical protein
MSSDHNEFHSNRWPPLHPDVVKIRISLDSDAPYETESMWARPIGDGIFVLDNVPFFAYGLSLGDKLFARTTGDAVLEYAGVAERSGHSTYRVFLSESSPAGRCEEYWRELEALGCGRETGTSRLWAVDLPPATDIFQVYRILQEAEAEGVWEFEEVHVAHEV